MEKSNKVVEEFEKYNYLLNDKTWKDELPGFTLYASVAQTYHPKVSIIIANYNNGPYLKRMMDSLMNQTIGIHRLQVMFIDDRSTDNSIEIVKPYTENYPNVEIYHLDRNTGGAHGPRNVGLLNARGEYLVFLDADDWYDPDGLKVLADLLDESGDGIAFGGIMRSTNGQLFRGDPAYIEMETKNRPISDLPYDFYSWLGPQANMVRASIVFENNLHFIDQRVADDVTFFIQILHLSGSISQTTKLTTYLNRDDDNTSLSKSVNETFMVSWLRALSYLKNTYELDTSLEKFMARRLEWLVIDFALRWDTGYGFSKDKVKHFANLIQEYIGELSFDPSKYFKTDARKIVWKAMKDKEFDFLVRFYEWHSLPFYDKKLELVNGHYFYVPDDATLPNVEINTRVEGNFVSSSEDEIVIDFNIYTNEKINYCELRSLHNPWLNQLLDIKHINDNTYQVSISKDVFDKLENDAYQVLIRTNNYHDNPILIENIERFTAPDTVIRNIDNCVAIEKRAVDKGYFLVVKDLTTDDITPSEEKNISYWVKVNKASFLSNGKFAREVDSGVRIKADGDYLAKLNFDDNNDSAEVANENIENAILNIIKENNTKLGYYRANENLDVFMAPNRGFAEKLDRIIKKGEFFPVINIIHGEDGLLYFEIEYGQFVLAKSELSSFIELSDDFCTELGLYQVNKADLPIYEEPSYSSKVKETLHYHDLFDTLDMFYDKENKAFIFKTDIGYISARTEDIIRSGEINNDGYYHVGYNFIVTCESVNVYSDNEMKKLAKEHRLEKGSMFKATNFFISHRGEYTIYVRGLGYISASKELYAQLNPDIKVTGYCLKQGKYVVKSKSEQGYRSPNFGNRFKSRSYKQGEVLNAIGFGVSEKGYPRLKLDDGNYITSNQKYVKFKGE